MLAQEVSDLIRGVVGQEAFSRGCADVLKELTATRESRKRERALEVTSLLKLLVSCDVYLYTHTGSDQS